VQVKKELIDIGIGTDKEVMVEDKLDQMEYLKALKRNNENQNTTDLLKLTEILAKYKSKGKPTVIRKKPNKSCHSMISMDFNAPGVSNIKTKTRSNTRLGKAYKKEKSKGNSISTGIKTDRSLRSVTNKFTRSSKELFLSSKEGSKKYKLQTDNTDLTQQSDVQKRSTQSLLRLTSRIFNQKLKDYPL